MPLLDHFHPPLSERRPWESIHARWCGSLADLFTGPYTAMPVIVYDWARKPQEEFRALTSAAILVLLFITILANAGAVLLRNRYEKRW